MRLAGRAEDAAALCDAWHLCPADADPGPAGAVFGAWRQLVIHPPAVSAERLAKLVELLGLAWDEEALADLCVAINNQVHAVRPAPFAAAAIAAVAEIVGENPAAAEEEPELVALYRNLSELTPEDRETIALLAERLKASRKL